MNRAAAAIFLSLVCWGCPKRIDFGPRGEISDPAALLALVQGAEAQVATLQGEARLRVDVPQGRGTVTLFVAVARPGHLHLETLDFFGRPLAVLVTDGERFGLYQAEERRYYQGPASPANVSRFLPVLIPGTELVSVMLGEAPRIEAEAMALRVDRKAGAYALTLRRGEVEQTLLVHPLHLRVVRSEVRGVPAYDLAFEDFAPAAEGVFPRRVELEAESADTRLELRYTDVELNGPPDLALFELIPPEGVPVVEVDAAGREVVPPAAPPPLTPLLPPGG